VLGPDRVVVGIERLAAGDPAQAAVQLRQHVLGFAQQRGGQVAGSQAGFQFLLGDQAQAALPTGQGGLGGQWLALLQRAPRTAEVVAEAAGDVLAVAAQLAHAVQEQQLRRTGALGPVEQDVVVTGHGHGEPLPQGGQERLAGLGQQGDVGGTSAECCFGRTHARGAPARRSETFDFGGRLPNRSRIVRPAAMRNRDQVGTSGCRSGTLTVRAARLFAGRRHSDDRSNRVPIINNFGGAAAPRTRARCPYPPPWRRWTGAVPSRPCSWASPAPTKPPCCACSSRRCGSRTTASWCRSASCASPGTRATPSASSWPPGPCSATRTRPRRRSRRTGCASPVPRWWWR